MGSAVWWTLVLIVIVIVGFVLAIRVKKWAGKDEDSSGDNFTLSDLRRLHKAGKMSTEEYEKARMAIVALAQKPPPKPVEPAARQPRRSDGGGVVPPM
jgi:hypothetical protein